MGNKVMVIDDEAESLNLVKFTLERAGFEVASCNDGGQAGDAVAAFKPDLIVLEVMLPGVDGYTLQMKLAAEAPTKDIPVIVLTALEPAKALFQKFPQVVNFMTKPFKAEELLENVQNVLSREPESHG